MAFPQLADYPYVEDEENNIWNSISEVLPKIALPFTEQTSGLYTYNSMSEISKQANQISEVEVPGMTTDSTASDLCELNDDICEKKPLDIKFGSLSTSSGSCNSPWVYDNCLNQRIFWVCGEDDLFSPHDPSMMCVTANGETECRLDKNLVDLIEGSTAVEEVQCHSSAPDDGEIDSQDKDLWHCDSVDDISVPETGNYSLMGPRHPPERLLSTRKVISPTCQERLSQAMKGIELIEDVNYSKCKENLHFKNAPENEPPLKGLGAENTKVDMHVELGAAYQSRVTIRPKRNTSKKKSPPKGNQKSPGLSRLLPNFSTGTKSLQRCSKSAMVFSQRQMHDFECLAMKLMQELNSMKDVEGKLHCKTSPTQKKKYDTEVKTAIKSARKTEKITRKWLSTMSRDCNRFCTIMKLSEKGEVASSNDTHKERRKITFADEAGGLLCHVKVFEDGMTSLNSQH